MKASPCSRQAMPNGVYLKLSSNIQQTCWLSRRCVAPVRICIIVSTSPVDWWLTNTRHSASMVLVISSPLSVTNKSIHKERGLKISWHPNLTYCKCVIHYFYTMCLPMLQSHHHNDQDHCAWSVNQSINQSINHLNVCSLIWGFGERCTIVHRITSQPANVLINVLYWHFCQALNGWLKFESQTFLPPPPRCLWGGAGSYGDVRGHNGPIW